MFRIFRHYFGFSSLFLVVFEMTILFGLLATLARLLHRHGMEIAADEGVGLAALMTLMATAGMTSVGLYNRENFVHMHQVVPRAMVVLPLVLTLVVMALGCADLVAPGTALPGSYVLGAAGLTAFFPVLIGIRELFIRGVDRCDWFKRRVVVVGRGHHSVHIERLSRQMAERAFTVVGIVHLATPPPPSAASGTACERHEHWVGPDQLSAFCHDNRVDEVVIAPTELTALPVHHLLGCKLSGIAVTEYASFWERESGQVELEAITPGWLVFSDGFRGGRLRRAIKRGFDLLFSALLLLATLPLTVVTALLIRLESPGPVFYRQQRVGLDGKVFNVLKFRSMRADAEKDGPRWAAKNDSRVTRVGAVIRLVRIDEIPQVFNVLAGDMSFVGPRPERPVFVEALAGAIPYYVDRHTVKPGITGWAQINYPYGATEEDARNKLAYDLYYVKNRSLFLDLIIMLQTVKVLLWNEGAR